MQIIQRIRHNSYIHPVTFRLHVTGETVTGNTVPKWSVIVGVGTDDIGSRTNERVVVGESTPVLWRRTRRGLRPGPINENGLQKGCWELMYWLSLPADRQAPGEYRRKYSTTRLADISDDEVWLRAEWGTTFYTHFREYYEVPPFRGVDMAPYSDNEDDVDMENEG